MAHEIETMAYAGQMPWHTLGNKVDSSVSVEEMTKAAGLDWTVSLKPCFAYDDDTKTAIPVGRQALVRDTDKKVLTVTGDNWHPLQNADAMGFFRDFTDAGGATLETAGSLRGGKVVWGLASLNDQFTAGVSTDIVKGYLLLVSHHEVGNATMVATTTVRVVCANTMRMAEHQVGRGAYRQNHLAPFDADSAKKAIDICRIQLGRAKLEADALTSLKLSEFEATRFLARFFEPSAPAVIKEGGETAFDRFVGKLLETPAEQNKIMVDVLDSFHNAPGAQPETGWGVLNAVTHWADHKAGREADARLFNSWLGKRSRLKLDINSKLLVMAGVNE